MVGALAGCGTARTTGLPATPATPAGLSPSPTPPSTAAPATTPPAPPHAVVVGDHGADFSRSRPGGAPIQHIAAGVVLPLDALQGGWAHVQTPCQGSGWVRLAGATTLSQVTVVLDPGHGGSELGAVGPSGLAEKDLNLDVANRVAALLRAQGISAVLDRTGDYTATLGFRVDTAASLHPALLLSLHHNAEPDGPSVGPGTETFYQYRSPASKRLAGLVYEEVTRALAPLPATWVANTDKGARWRLNDAGGDYYGILRLAGTRNLTAGLGELLFITNPSEEALLRRDDVRTTEAEAVTRAIVRFLTTQDPGSGFSSPHPRQVPAGGGGGTQGCVDPITP